MCIPSHRKKNFFKKKTFIFQSPQPSSGLTDTEKKEKQALEKKLAEMEEELKVSLKKLEKCSSFEHLIFDARIIQTWVAYVIGISYSVYFTVWNFSNFPAILILHEINFG